MRCAERSWLDEPLAGTAPEARGFVVVEHPGPWGAQALEEAGLEALEQACKSRGLRALLARRRGAQGSRAFAAWCGREPFLVELDGAPTDDLLDALAEGGRPPGAPRERLWLVCTNGKRDACCAVDGMPVARALAERGEEVWECTHLGGHRFAANVLLLPEGICFGRVQADTVDVLLEGVAAGAPPAELMRGRTALEPLAQAAEIAAGPSLVLPEIERDGDVVRIGARRIRVASRTLEPRPVSCDAEPEPVVAWNAELLA